MSSRLTLSRWAFLLNAGLLLLNAYFIAINYQLLPTGANEKEVAFMMERRSGTDAAYLNNPISLYVDKDFPKENRVVLFDESHELLISSDNATPTDHNGAERRIRISLGADQVIEGYYTADEFVQVTYATSEKLFVDMNADGFYDLQIQFHSPDSVGQRAEMKVWYKQEWRAVKPGRVWGVGTRVLRDGGTVTFDRASGQWKQADKGGITD